MSEKLFQIEFSKPAFKFSAGHMTVFSEKKKEALHGHNYQVAVSLQIDSTLQTQFVSFSTFKKPIYQLCAEWDEKVLLPGKCPFLKVHNAEEIKFDLCGRRYQIPKDEVVLLPIDNVTCENLSALFLERYLALIGEHCDPKLIMSASVTIWESSGQGVTAKRPVCRTN